MKRQPRILAGTALGLLIASAPFGAFPLLQARAAPLGAEIILAQAECPEGQECAEQPGEPQQEKPSRKERRQKQQQDEGAGQAQPEVQQEQPAAEPQAEPEPQQPRRERQKRNQQQQDEGAGQAQPEVQQEQPAAEPQAEPEPQQPRRERQKRNQAPTENQEPIAPDAQNDNGGNNDAGQNAEPSNQNADQPAENAEQPAKPRRQGGQRNNQQPAETQEVPTVAPTPDVKPDAPAPEIAPVPEAAPAQPAEQPANDNAAPADQSGGNAGQVPADAGAPAQTEAPVVDPTAGPNAAPVLDSQKEEPVEPTRRGGRNQAGQDGQGGDGQRGQRPPRPAAVDPGPPPESDKAATEAAQPEKVESVREERGRRVDRRPSDEDFRRRERPAGLDVLKSIGDRVIIQFGDQISVESNDRPRMSRGAQEVYYEDLPRGRTRETIVRENGNQIVTIRDEYGDVIRRSRITPDGREYVLSYVDEQNYERVRDRRDPGYDLPPMRLNVPIDEYILNADRVDDPEEYYEFLDQPPVERVQRLYSVDEVKRSARVRDIARRVDLDTLTFEFGSAEVPESQVEKLEGVANAIEKLLQKNPAETFLIEGHTDAVGSDEANLALSDRRAEAVADALTNVFAIPPENLATQGYGERYLKVKSEKPERENRRVGIRRITPLVAPVASAN